MPTGVAVLGADAALRSEFQSSRAPAAGWCRQRLTALSRSDDFLDAVAASFPPDAASQAMAAELLAWLRGSS